MKLRLGFIFSWLLSFVIVTAQNYQAIHGSSHAGALGAANNPASIVHVPYSWDLTLFSVQAKHSTNAFVINDFSLISPGKNSEVLGVNGSLKRFLFANQDIHLFNTRIRLNSRKAIAFGANLRSYVYSKSSTLHFEDTLSTVRQFMTMNLEHVPLQAELRGSSWAELFGTYAWTIRDDEFKIINAGITLTATRSLAGGYLAAGNVNFVRGQVNGSNGTILSAAELQYGYSTNIDDVEGPGNFSAKRKRFMERTFSSLSLSVGGEYIVPMDLEGDAGNGYNYDLKIGVSLLDLGFNNFKYSRNSRAITLNAGNISDSLLEAKFEGAEFIEGVNDSLATIASSFVPLDGMFKMFSPARAIINVDKHLQGHFFVNAELSLPLVSLLGTDRYVIRDMNLLAITPRYETRAFGVYLPFTLNNKKQAWLGGAFKAGPLLVGLHNWGNVFAKNKMQQGGYYVALTFRPGKKRDQESRVNGKKLSRREQRMLECPRGM